MPNGFKDKTLYDFKTYFDKATGRNIDKRPVEEIMQEIDEAMRRLNNGN